MVPSHSSRSLSNAESVYARMKRVEAICWFSVAFCAHPFQMSQVDFRFILHTRPTKDQCKHRIYIHEDCHVCIH